MKIGKEFKPYMKNRTVDTNKVMEAAKILYDSMNYPKSEPKKTGKRYLYGQIMLIICEESENLTLK